MSKLRENCIVLAGGRGTRLARLTAGGNKHLAPLGGRPALLHVFPPILATPTIQEIGVVTNRASAPAMDAALAQEEACARIPLYFQDEPNGTLPAVLAADDLLNEDRFAVHYGDNIFAWNALPPLAETFPEEAAAVLYCLAQSPPDLPRYGVVEYVQEKSILWVRSFQEKPEVLPEEPFLLMSGFFRFRRDAFLEAAPLVEKSCRDEWELPSIVPALQSLGHKVAVHILDIPWNDYGTEESFPLAENVLMARNGD